MNAEAQEAVLLKGSLFTLTVLQLLTTDLDKIASHLHVLTKQLPNFFQYTPIVIDLQHIASGTDIDLMAINQALRARYMIPVGVRNYDAGLHPAIIAAGLAMLPAEKATKTQPQQAVNLPKPKELQQELPYVPSKLVTQPVRSGQQIYAQGGDLIVLSSVSNGAELLADGHIHVYGNLRGRALAGINGDKNARIFCKHLEAELVSIAGFYRIKEDLPPTSYAMTQIYLEKEHLVIDEA